MFTKPTIFFSGLKGSKIRRRGVILVAVLWILVTLAVLALGLSMGTRLDNSARVLEADRLQARWLAFAGISRAVSILAEDDRAVDSPRDDWYDNAGQFSQVTMEQGSFSVYAADDQNENKIRPGIEDESARLQILRLPPEQLALLAGMDQPEGVILQKQFQSAATLPALETLRQLGGATDYSRDFLYGEDTNLNGILDPQENDGDASWPPDDRDGRLKRGLLAWLTVYAYDLEKDRDGQPRVNINSASLATLKSALGLNDEHALWIVEHRPYQSIADLLSDTPQVAENQIMTINETVNGEAREFKRVITRPNLTLFRAMVDKITITDDPIVYGRLNINTAPRQTLLTIPRLRPEIIDSLITLRLGLAQGFIDLGSLLDIPGITIADFRIMVPCATVRSQVFRIHSRGAAANGAITHEIEAVIDRGGKSPRILYWKESR